MNKMRLEIIIYRPLLRIVVGNVRPWTFFFNFDRKFTIMDLCVKNLSNKKHMR